SLNLACTGWDLDRGFEIDVTREVDFIAGGVGAVVQLNNATVPHVICPSAQLAGPHNAGIWFILNQAAIPRSCLVPDLHWNRCVQEAQRAGSRGFSNVNRLAIRQVGGSIP